VEVRGFEPRRTACKADMLPLHHTPLVGYGRVELPFSSYQDDVLNRSTNTRNVGQEGIEPSFSCSQNKRSANFPQSVTALVYHTIPSAVKNLALGNAPMTLLTSIPSSKIM
jgi:hypothetical protein